MRINTRDAMATNMTQQGTNGRKLTEKTQKVNLQPARCVSAQSHSTSLGSFHCQTKSTLWHSESSSCPRKETQFILVGHSLVLSWTLPRGRHVRQSMTSLGATLKQTLSVTNEMLLAQSSGGPFVYHVYFNSSECQDRFVAV